MATEQKAKLTCLLSFTEKNDRIKSERLTSIKPTRKARVKYEFNEKKII